MKHNNKKILSIMLTLCMVLSLFSGAAVTANAAEAEGGPTTLYVNGEDMLNGGTVAGVTYDKDTATLTLTDATLDKFHVDSSDYAKKAGVIYAAGGNLTIELKGDNTITFGDNTENPGNVGGIFSQKGDLTITGNGTLTIQNKTTNSENDGYQYFSGIYAYGNYQNEANLSIEGGAVVNCTADSSKLTGSIYGVNVAYGTLTVDSSTLSITTKDSTKGNYGIFLGSEYTHKLTGNTTVTVVAGQSDESDNSWGIEPGYESSIQIGAGAKLYASSQTKAFRDNGTIKAADGATLTAKGSTMYNVASDDLTEMQVNNNTINLNETYKTIEITASSSSTSGGSNSGLDLSAISESNLQGAAYAEGVYTNTEQGWTWNSKTNTLTLTGCTIEATEADSNGIKLPDEDVELILQGKNHVSAANGSAITGCQNNTLTISGSGSLEAKADKQYSSVVSCGNLVLNSGTLDLVATSAIYMGIKASNNVTVNGGTLRAEGFKNGAICCSGKVAINGGHVTISVVSGTAIAGTNNITVNSKATITGGESAESVTTVTDVNYKYLDITVPAPAAATFADGFGSTVADADKYVKGETKNDKGYTFDGWVDADGKVVDSAALAEAGKAYTAKWTNNGKTVRTTPLDLSDMSTIDKSADEGWSWDEGNKTLTLSGATLDITAPGGDSPIAVTLPADAKLKTAAGTTNKVAVKTSSDVQNGVAIFGLGDISIDGDGTFEVIGQFCGIGSSSGNITINTPITVSATGDRPMGAIFTASKEDNAITINAPLSIVDPAGGRAFSDEEGTRIIEEDGNTIAKKVVIGKKTSGGDDEQTYTISGTVNKTQADDSENPVKGATVELKKADGEKAASDATTDLNGAYNFGNVPNGVYNIIVTTTDGQTMTKLIKVSGAIQANIVITLPKDNVSSVVEVKSGTQPVLVGGLDEEAKNYKENDKTVTVKLTVEKKAESDVSTEAAGIRNLASGKVLEYLNIELKKFINSETGVSINNTTNLLEIIVPYGMTGKNNITVYRHHDRSAEAFRQLSSLADNNKGDGTYYLDKDNNLIHIFTNQFSTYAIGYNTSSGSSSGGSYIVQKPEVTTNTGGKAELSADGTTATITPDADYEIESVLLNGKDMGKVNKLTGLKTGDKVVVTFQKKSEEPTVDTKTIAEKVSKMKLTARSAKTTKKNIKITVKTDKETNNLIKEIKDLGYTVKYKYYRSTKKASKYTARIEKDADINSYINTFGKKGTRYYYRVKVMVYDADGNFIAKSDLKQCKYAARIWSK